MEIPSWEYYSTCPIRFPLTKEPSLEPSVAPTNDGDTTPPSAVPSIKPTASPTSPTMLPSSSPTVYDPQAFAMRSLVTAWGNWGGFDVSADPCTWGMEDNGVHCDGNGVVYLLHLNGRGFQGEIVTLHASLSSYHTLNAHRQIASHPSMD